MPKHKLTFHNLGSADCIRIDLTNGKKILFDYANMRAEERDDLRCDLPETLRQDLGDRDYYDVVAFTHLDNDHICGSTSFFRLDFAEAYQSDVDGKKRVEMREMWVPAAVITEPLPIDRPDEAKVLQKEARFRFKQGEGIRVFSRPERLRKWCEKNDVDFESRRSIITDAGKVIPGFDKASDSVEFFAHAPFAHRQDDNSVEDRNEDSLVVHATFWSGGSETRLFLASDIGHENLGVILDISETHGNEDRLRWDIFKLPHHCSHHAISSQPREGEKSIPEPKVKKLFEDYGEAGCLVVSTSWPIPAAGSKEDGKNANPPHRQAANYFKEDVVDKTKDFRVTMEHPDTKGPKPMEIEIDHLGATVKAIAAPAIASAASSRPPRAG